MLWLFALHAQAQMVVRGRLTDGQLPLAGAHIRVMSEGAGSISTNDGSFSIGTTSLPVRLRISYLGFETLDTLLKTNEFIHQLVLKADKLGLSQVVVSASRVETDRREATVPVQVLAAAQLRQLQAPALTEGLPFGAGIRTENNCQSCGFTAVRLNGLPGAYTQLLLDGRPVFSALNGVYGLDQLPTAMIGRLEVVRGGGSVLYGGNAIAGTVNLITREPVANGFSLWQQNGLIGGRSLESNTQFHLDLVSDDLRSGVTLYGTRRFRDWYDHNADQISDLTLLNGGNIGANGFHRFSKRLHWKGHVYGMQEFRRGGSDFDLLPHQSAIAEQLEHRVFGFRNELSWYSADYRHRLQVYNASQFTRRNSYYGGGGRVLAPGDSLTEADLLALNAYGEANDRSLVSGLNWQWNPSDRLQLVSGLEHWHNRITDAMPGYRRLLDQEYRVWGSFVQAEYRLSKRLKLLGGLRFDQVRLQGRYDLATDVVLQDRLFPLLLPRTSLLFNANDHNRIRLNWAQGYRAPQAFDEDLHIALVGGSARFVRLGNDLVPERSNSVSLAYENDQPFGNTQQRFGFEAFYTRLQNPFLLLDAEVLPGGTQVINKRNGSGVTVFGVNLTQQLALDGGTTLELGFTWQQALLSEAEVLWESASGDTLTTTNRMLRTPDAYGYATYRQPLGKGWTLQSSLLYTGRMWVPHVLDAETAYTELKRTPHFVDAGLFVERNWVLTKRMRLESSLGVQNLLNSFQRDLDAGPNRDAAYVYGPLRPRTLLLSLRWVY